MIDVIGLLVGVVLFIVPLWVLWFVWKRTSPDPSGLAVASVIAAAFTALGAGMIVESLPRLVDGPGDSIDGQPATVAPGLSVSSETDLLPTSTTTPAPTGTTAPSGPSTATPLPPPADTPGPTPKRAPSATPGPPSTPIPTSAPIPEPDMELSDIFEDEGSEPTPSSRRVETTLTGSLQSARSQIAAMLPDESDVPNGLIVVEERRRLLEEVAGNYADPDEARAYLSESGWRGNVIRRFGPPEGVLVSLGNTSSVYVSITRYGSAEGTARALTYSFEDQLAATSRVVETTSPALCDVSRAMVRTTDEGTEVTLNCQVGTVLIRITTFSVDGDPYGDAIAVLEVILAKM